MWHVECHTFPLTHCTEGRRQISTGSADYQCQPGGGNSKLQLLTDRERENFAEISCHCRDKLSWHNYRYLAILGPLKSVVFANQSELNSAASAGTFNSTEKWSAEWRAMALAVKIIWWRSFLLFRDDSNYPVAISIGSCDTCSPIKRYRRGA